MDNHCNLVFDKQAVAPPTKSSIGIKLFYVSATREKFGLTGSEIMITGKVHGFNFRSPRPSPKNVHNSRVS
jgi:hypothetical protein